MADDAGRHNPRLSAIPKVGFRGEALEVVPMGKELRLHQITIPGERTAGDLKYRFDPFEKRLRNESVSSDDGIGVVWWEVPNAQDGIDVTKLFGFLSAASLDLSRSQNNRHAQTY